MTVVDAVLVELDPALARGARTRAVDLGLDRVAGRLPGRTVLTHPAGWANLRLGILIVAAERAGPHGVSLVAEPVAAAAYGLRHVPQTALAVRKR